MEFCRGPNRKTCEFAFALRNSEKTDCLDSYLLGGDITPEVISTYIIHNNEFHNGWTYEQLGHFIRILEARRSVTSQEYSKNIVKLIEKKVDENNLAKILKKERLKRAQARKIEVAKVADIKKVEVAKAADGKDTKEFQLKSPETYDSYRRRVLQ